MKVPLHFKCGTMEDIVNVNDSLLHSDGFLAELAAIVTEKFPRAGFSPHKAPLFFVHDYSSPNILVRLTKPAQLHSGCHVEVILPIIDAATLSASSTASAATANSNSNGSDSTPPSLVKRHSMPDQLLNGQIVAASAASAASAGGALDHHDFDQNDALASAATPPRRLTNPDSGGDLSGKSKQKTATLPGGFAGQPHRLSIKSYKKPTFCDYCNELLWGLVRQGLRCEDCQKNFHKRCAYKQLNSCDQAKEITYVPRTPTMPHNFAVHTYKTLTVCGFCKKLLWGVARQGLQCSDCGYNSHRKCVSLVPQDCGFGYVDNSVESSLASSLESTLQEARKLVAQHAIPDIDGSLFNFEKGSLEDKTKALSELEDRLGHGRLAEVVALLRVFSKLWPDDVFGPKEGDDIDRITTFFGDTNTTKPKSRVSNGSLNIDTANIPLHRLMNVPADFDDDHDDGSISDSARSSAATITPLSQGTSPSSAPITAAAAAAAAAASSSSATSASSTTVAAGEQGKPRKVHLANGHEFVATHFHVPTFCQHCDQFIWGAGKQGYKCSICQFKCHKKCHEDTPPCPGSVAVAAAAVAAAVASSTNSANGSFTLSSSPSSPASIPSTPLAFYGTPTITLTDVTTSTSSPRSSIVSMSQLDNSVAAKEGWLVHHTNKDAKSQNARKRRYWRLTSQAMTAYVSEKENKSKDIIPLSKITGVEVSAVTQLSFCFELKTKKCTYMMETDGELVRQSWMLAIQEQLQLSSLQASQSSSSLFVGSTAPHSGSFTSINSFSSISSFDSGASELTIIPRADSTSLPASPVATVAPVSALAAPASASKGAAPALSASVATPPATTAPVTATTTTTATATAIATAQVHSPKKSGSAGDLLSIDKPVSDGSSGGSRGPAPPAPGSAGSGQKRPDPLPSKGSQSSINSNELLPSGGASKTFRHPIDNDFDVRREHILGSGQFGVVVSATEKKHGKVFAVKIINRKKITGDRGDPSKAKVNSFKNEIHILQSVRHPGIITLDSIYESPDKIYLVMEMVEGGDMLDRILGHPVGKLPERETKFLIYQILVALKYLHEINIAHRDLKPENVLLMNKHPFPQTKLCDFGFAKIVGENSFMMSIVGTPAYVAPEVLEDDDNGYQRSVDLWSVGVIIYVSLSGTFPFNEDEEIRDQIQNAHFMFPPSTWGHISPSAIDLIKSLLTVDPGRRCTVDKALAHPWLNDPLLRVDISDLEVRIGEHYLSKD